MISNSHHFGIIINPPVMFFFFFKEKKKKQLQGLSMPQMSPVKVPFPLDTDTHIHNAVVCVLTDPQALCQSE